ncbi:MAG: phosphate acyltransferase, partial [Pseudomonadota bacterium]|nr:phosphate acyltransferase [Pseudomonadota bacterium]
MSLTIALDAMGGDQAPAIVINGADLARRRFPDVKYLMFGNENQILPLIRPRKRLLDVTEIMHTDVLISNETKV